VAVLRHDRDGLVRCRVCDCTDREPCNPPCAWVEADLCSNCWNAVAHVYNWALAAHRFSWVALTREVKARIVAGLSTSGGWRATRPSRKGVAD
jgi:hypothetical protein